jgi:putative spermidine/putrescine transport system ATP-binding protein
MSEVAGRMAPQVGAHHLQRDGGGRGVLMGGVSGVHAAKVVVLGAGVSGMNAAAIALGMQAEVLLFDEPLSNLDARLRDEMRFEIRDLQRRIGITTVLVTHDIEEAFVMSDRMAVMQAGKIMQIGRADEIYRSPASRFVANFVGPINELALSGIEIVNGRRRGLAPAGRGPGLAREGRTVWLPESGNTHDGKTTLVLRPEALRVASGDIGTENSFPAEIVDVVYLGGNSECRLKLGTLQLSAVIPSAAAAQLRPGERVRVGWDADDGVILDAG